MSTPRLSFTTITTTLVTTTIDPNFPLVRLLQLASPALPVGAYSYSQGLESAIDEGIVRDAASAEGWIADVLEFSMVGMELPILFRMIENQDALGRWNAIFLASRETAELRAQTVHMGISLDRLLPELIIEPLALEEPAVPATVAAAVVAWKVEPPSALSADLRTRRA